MRAVVQRVSRASIRIDRKIERSMGGGLVILLGIEEADTDKDIEWLSNKILRLRIFNDENGVMNLSLEEVNGEVMIISQFTLHASTKKGNRPSYIRAAKPNVAIPLYETFVDTVRRELESQVITGKFGAYMEIDMVNDGPVTILIDTKNKE